MSGLSRNVKFSNDYAVNGSYSKPKYRKSIFIKFD